MPRQGKRKKGAYLVAIAVAVALIVVVSAVRWAKPKLFPDLTAEAADAYSRSDWSRTAQLANQRLKQKPEDPQALRLAARAAARQDRDQTAIAIYSRLDVGLMTPEDFFLMGRALSRTGQAEPALKALETAQAEDPDHPETLDFLCRLYYQTDRYYAAEATALRLARNPAWEARAQLMLGLARAELENPVGVVTALKRWLQLDPEGKAAAPDPVRPIQMLLARSLLKSRQPEEARRVLQGILEKGPEPEASWLLSRALVQEGNWKQAEAVIKQDSSYRAAHPFESEPAPFVGSARCAECHRPESQAVLASRHASTFWRPADLVKLPLPKDVFADPGNPQVSHQFQQEGNALRVVTRTKDHIFRAVVDYAFGSLDHFTTYAGHDDQNRSFMLRISTYESSHGLACDLSTGLARRPSNEEEYLGKNMPQGDGVRRCLFCHTTSFRAALDQAGPEAADHSIGCEKCHGPGGHHVETMKAGFSDLAIAGSSQDPATEINKVCAQCHGFPRAEVLSASRTDPAWYRFQSVALTWSRCYVESDGKLSCVTCHDPHRNADASTARNEAKCLSCHSAKPSSVSAVRAATPVSAHREAQTFCPVSPARGCLQCHMPRVWQQDTHTFKTDHFIRVRDRDRLVPENK